MSKHRRFLIATVTSACLGKFKPMFCSETCF
jgi:hypothetical protein